MENKIYYGEYTLRHWIELILKKNIILPPYQRNFVWKEKKVLELIKALEKKEFIPPITLGIFKTDTETQNLILDGQQRLTSILLAYFNIMPDPDTFKAKKDELTMGHMAEGDEIEEYISDLDDVLDWTFKELTKKGNNKDIISSQIISGNYKSLNRLLSEEFFEDRYLGFSYIVPQDEDPRNQQKFYSTVFRNINMQGQPLLAQESREALYYFNREMPDFFKPEFCKNIKLRPSSANAEIPLDFVRYMSLLSQYHAEGVVSHLARGFRSNMEQYYENYIYSVLKENENTTYSNFDTIFPNNNYPLYIGKLTDAIEQLELQKKSPFTSIIDMDAYLFGLIYQIVFQKKRLNATHIEAIKAAIDNQISTYKRDSYHRSSPNAFKYMRPRVIDSINTYSNYVIAE